MKRLIAIAALSMSALTGCVYEDGYYDDDCYECQPDPTPYPTPYPAQYERIAMWADAARASSNGLPGSTDYAEVQALGPADVEGCFDDPHAWSPETAHPTPGTAPNGDTIDDWLEVTFFEPVWVYQIKIYESFNPGAIVAVDLESADGFLLPLVAWEDFSGDGPAPCPSAFVITIPETTYEQFDRVVIYLDSNLVGDSNHNGTPYDDFNAIDAVELIGDVQVF